MNPLENQPRFDGVEHVEILRALTALQFLESDAMFYDDFALESFEIPLEFTQ